MKKVKIESVGPVTRGTSKASGKPYTIYDLQFEGDTTWYSTFWSRDDEPKAGMELEGETEFNDKFDKWNFKVGGGFKKTYNPAAANAAVFNAAVAAVNGYLSLDNHFDQWKKQRKEKEHPFNQYMDTVSKAAEILKEKVIGLGSMNETPAPKQPDNNDGDPGPQEPPNTDEEEIDLGPI